MIGIDLNTGKGLRPFATHEFGIERYDKHPDTDFDFSHLQIPNWEVVKQQILISAQKLTQLNLVGWDIAVTNQGVTVIEANTLFSIDLPQAGFKGIKDLFLIGDPKCLKNIHNFKGK